MGHYEDEFYEIYNNVRDKGLTEQFYAQLEKMSLQDKHKFKSPKEFWSYAYQRVQDSLEL